MTDFMERHAAPTGILSNSSSSSLNFMPNKLSSRIMDHSIGFSVISQLLELSKLNFTGLWFSGHFNNFNIFKFFHKHIIFMNCNTYIDNASTDIPKGSSNIIQLGLDLKLNTKVGLNHHHPPQTLKTVLGIVRG